MKQQTAYIDGTCDAPVNTAELAAVLERWHLMCKVAGATETVVSPHVLAHMAALIRNDKKLQPRPLFLDHWRLCASIFALGVGWGLDLALIAKFWLHWV